MVTRFYKNLALKDLELEIKAVTSIRRYDEVRELVRSLGLDITD